MMRQYLRIEGARIGACSTLLLAVFLANGVYAAEPPISVLPTPLSAAIDAPIVMHQSAQAAAPGDCQISIGKNRFDYGRFTKGALSIQGVGADELVVGRQITLVNVTCPTPQRVAVFFRAAGDIAGRAYRFGEQGKVRLALLNAQADGQSVQLGEGDSATPATAWAEQAALVPNRGVTLQNDRAVSRLSLQLEAVATVQANAKSPATAQRWSDSGQLQLRTY